MFREYLVYSVTSVQAPIPHGEPGGSGSHGHSKVNRFHAGWYSMPVREMRQEGTFIQRMNTPKFHCRYKASQYFLLLRPFYL